MFTGTIEVEQRIWLRRQWRRQIAVIEAPGLLKISSSSVYDKLEYSLSGAVAVLQDGCQSNDGITQPPMFHIKLDPSAQAEGVAVISFRLISVNDIMPWLEALSRHALFYFAAIKDFLCTFNRSVTDRS